MLSVLYCYLYCNAMIFINTCIEKIATLKTLLYNHYSHRNIVKLKQFEQQNKIDISN